MQAKPAGTLTGMVGKYVTEKTGVVFADGMFSAFLIESETSEFVGGIVISNFRGTDCELSCAAETPVAFQPHVLRAIFQYVFGQLGCVRCTSITTKQNKRARKFLTALGFTLEGNVRLGYDGRKDALIYGLLSGECRFYPAGGLHGEEINASGTGRAGPGSDGAGTGDHK